jgi:hypothetical protein
MSAAGAEMMALPAYNIVVDFVSEGEVANLIRGYVEVAGKRVRFSGVAYGRFGGQNFSPQFSDSSKKKLVPLVESVDGFIEDVQQRLVRGEFEAKPPAGEKHHHHHLGEAAEAGES